MKKRISIIFASLFVFFLLTPSLASAQQSGLQISPLTFNYEVENGGEESGKVIVTNLNDEAINYQLEAEDFVNVSDEGSPSFSGIISDESISTLSTWIKFAGETTGQLAAKESIDVFFTIDIPEDAEPGGHYAAVFAKQINDVLEGNTEIGVSSRVGTLILVSVPGEVSRGATISDFNPPAFIWSGPLDFNFKVHNIGTVHYDSTGAVVVDPVLGNTIEIDAGTHTIVPENARNFVAEWNKRFPIGYYTVSAQATDGDGNIVTEQKTIWALPLEIIVPAIVLILLIIWIAKIIKRKYKIVANN